MGTQKPSTQTSIDERIIELLQTQDEEAIRLIYDQYAPVLYNIILRIVKEEATAQNAFQEAMVKVWRYGNKYHTEKGSLFTWLVSLCKNTAIDKTRSKEYKISPQKVSHKKLAFTLKDQPSPQQTDLTDLLQQLPEKQKILIDMSFFQGYTHEEIAKKLDIPLGTVKTRIRSAIKKLRKILS